MSNYYNLVFKLTFFLLSILDNIFGDKMKKYIVTILGSIVVGYFLASFLFKQYDYDDNIKTVFSSDTKVYLIQQGVYSSLESMKENMIGFNYYIYSYENYKYYTYIAITKSLENLEKLKGYYKSLGYSIYVKEIDINSSDYINILDQYDNLLSTTDKKETIDAIMMQVLSKYEEMNMND